MLLNEQDFIISARNFLLPTGNYEALGNASRWYVFKGFTADIIDWWEIRSVTYLQLLKNSKKDWRGTGRGGGAGWTSNKLPGYEANLNFIAINLRLTTYRLLFEEILKPPSNLLSRINPSFEYFKQMEECG